MPDVILVTQLTMVQCNKNVNMCTTSGLR